MRLSGILVIVIWLLSLFLAFIEGLDIPKPIVINNQVIEMMGSPALLPFPFLFFLAAAFFQRKSMFDVKFIRNYTDKHYGSGVYKNFMSRLKPSILFMISLLVMGMTGLVATFVSNKIPSSYYTAGFFLSGGLGLLGAYMLSIKYPPRLE